MLSILEFWRTCPVLLCPALRVQPDLAAFYPVNQAAPRTARYLLADQTDKFSHSKTDSATDGALNVGKVTGEFSQKIHG